jgi:glycosyltransferase involved in cell wall biosynthesis
MKPLIYEKGKVSICVPTYNRPKLICKLLDSILAQTYENFEVIITDNSDNIHTKELIESIYKDRRIRYFKNESNLGMGGNTIKALSFVSGEFLTFTPDDDVWTDKDKLKKQVNFLNKNNAINIIYTNAKSIDYDGNQLDDFGSVYLNKDYDILNAEELLPGNGTKYFLNILTPVIRTEPLIYIFRESWSFESEEYFCYYIAATQKNIGFLYDCTVSLREAEHYRTAVEDGKIVDWKKRKDIRIRQMFNIYNTLTTLHPQTKDKLETPKVQNFLAKYLIGQASASRSIKLISTTIASCYLFFRKYSLIKSLKFSNKEGKSFG